MPSKQAPVFDDSAYARRDANANEWSWYSRLGRGAGMRAGSMLMTDEDDEPDFAEVELVVVGDALDPSTITATVGLQPSRAWKKRETYASRSGQTLKRWRGLWATTCASDTVEKAARDLLERVEPRAATIERVARDAGATVGVSIWWEPAARQGGFTLPSDVVRRLASLSSTFNVYLPSAAWPSEGDRENVSDRGTRMGCR